MTSIMDPDKMGIYSFHFILFRDITFYILHISSQELILLMTS